jgi:hypothetical protein
VRRVDRKVDSWVDRGGPVCSLVVFDDGEIRVPQAQLVIGIVPLADDDDFALDQVTEDLADDLGEIGAVRRIAQPARGAGDKGVGEVVVGAVTVLAGTDPACLQTLGDIVVAFLKRHEGRRVHLRVGDVEFTIDQPSRKEAAQLIETVRAAVERAGDG